MTPSRLTVPGRWFAAICIPGLLVILAFGLYSSNAGAAAADPLVRLSVSGQARVGQPVVVDIVAENVRNVAGYQADIGFGDSLGFVKGGVADGLRGSGRDLLTFGPIERDGSVTLGAASCPASGCNVANPRKAGRITNGVSGRFVLAQLEFAAAAPGQYTLDLSNVKLVDPQGNLITTAAQGINVSVTR